MNEIYFTSDTHFGHGNIITFCDRPYDSIEHMDEDLIARWNSKVGRGDTVYHLGDFSWYGADKTLEILERLNGQIRFIRGNHDAVLDNARIKNHKKVITIRDIDSVLIPGMKIPSVLCHYPMLAWNRSFHGAWMLHGHVHAQFDFSLNPGWPRLDVGVDSHGMDPLAVDELKLAMKTNVAQPKVVR